MSILVHHTTGLLEMRFIVAILFSLILLSCQNSVIEPEEQLPEELSALENLVITTANGPQKLEVYWQLYKILRWSEPNKALEYLILQEKLSDSFDNYLMLGKALFGQGLILKNQSDYIQAVDKYILSINAFERTNEVTLIGSCLNNLGGIFAETGNYEYAEKFYERARTIHATNKDQERIVLADLNLAICSYSKKTPDYGIADEHFRNAISLAESLPEAKIYLNWIYNTIGAMEYKRHAYEAAIASYLKSMEYIDPSANVEELQFVAYTNISEAALGAGNYQEAHKWMNKAMLLDGEQIAEPIRVGSYNLRGKLYQEQQKHTEAVAILEQAIDMAEKAVINEPLQESLLLIRESYRQLNESGMGVSHTRYDQILELDAQQDDLVKEMAEKTNFQVTIELDNEIKAKHAEKELKILYIALAIVILLLGVVVALFLMYRARQIEKEYASYRSNLTDTMREGFQRLVNWKGKEENIKWLKERGW